MHTPIYTHTQIHTHKYTVRGPGTKPSGHIHTRSHPTITIHTHIHTYIYIHVQYEVYDTSAGKAILPKKPPASPQAVASKSTLAGKRFVSQKQLSNPVSQTQKQAAKPSPQQRLSTQRGAGSERFSTQKPTGIIASLTGQKTAKSQRVPVAVQVPRQLSGVQDVMQKLFGVPMFAGDCVGPGCVKSECV